MGSARSFSCFDDAAFHTGIGMGQASVLPYALLGLSFPPDTPRFVEKEIILLMTQRSRNILLVALSLLLFSGMVIPAGCRNGWPLWLFFLTGVMLCAGLCLSMWNMDFAFNPVPLDKFSRWDKALYFLSFFVMIVGFDFIFGLFGNGSISVIIGCAIFLAFPLVLRYLAKKYGP